MPSKRKTSKRMYRKKPTVATAKKVVRKYHKKQKKTNSDTFALTVKSSAQIVPIQGATVANYFYTTIPLMDGTNSIGVTQNSEFILFRNMYDQVRVNSVLIKVTPKANVLDQYFANTDSALTLNGDGMVHTVVDRDSMPPTSIQTMSRYPSYKKYSLLKPFVRKYSISWPKGVWLDCQNLYENGPLLRQVGALGGICLYAEDVIEDKSELLNEPYADIQIYYNVVFRGKTQGALSYDPETDSVAVRAIDTLPSLTPTPLVNVRGTIADKLSSQVDVGGDGGISETQIDDIQQPR